MCKTKGAAMSKVTVTKKILEPQFAPVTLTIQLTSQVEVNAMAAFHNYLLTRNVVEVLNADPHPAGTDLHAALVAAYTAIDGNIYDVIRHHMTIDR
jgi:hypothetical protein